MSEQAVSRRRVEPVRAGSEFGERIEDTLWHWPAEHAVTAELGTRVIGHEQNVWPGRIWWRRSELVLPNSEPTPTTQFMGNKTHRLRPVAGRGGELEVRHHDLAECVKHLGKAAKTLDHGMLDAGDHAIAIGDPH